MYISPLNDPSTMKVLLLVGILLPFAASTMTGGKHVITEPISLREEPVVYAINLINENFKKEDSNAANRVGVKVLSGTSQVVAGISYQFKIEISGGPTNEICDVQVLTRAWLPPPANFGGRVMKCTAVKQTDDNLTAKAMLFGGPEPADWHDKYVQDALKHLAQRINSAMNSMYLYIPTGGVVTKQIVNGINYTFKQLKMAKTTCLKSDQTVTLSNCAVDSNAAESTELCGNVYWNPRADVKFTVTITECEDAQPSPKATVEYKVLTANMNDDDVQRALSKLVDRINMACNCMYRQVPVNGAVTKEVENGLTYRFTNLKMVETTCRNTDSSDKGKLSDECPTNANSVMDLPDCSGDVSWHPLAKRQFVVRSTKC